MATFTIGENLNIASFSTKQKGYGRQALYLDFAEIPGSHYICDVYPNVIEHYDILLYDDAYEHNRDEQGRFCKKYYVNGNGNGHYDRYYNSVEEFLNEYFKGEEIEIKD